MSQKRSPATKRRAWIAAAICLIGSIEVLALSVYGFKGLLVPLNALNPMLLAFLESFSIVNNTGEAVEVMPIGMTTVTGRYGPLPRYRNFFLPAVPLSSSQPIRLSPGARAKVTYDYDDINFRHLLIKDGGGNIYILDTDKRGSKHGAYGPRKDAYIIPPLKDLSPCPESLIQCFYGETVVYEGACSYTVSTISVRVASQLSTSAIRRKGIVFYVDSNLFIL